MVSNTENQGNKRLDHLQARDAGPPDEFYRDGIQGHLSEGSRSPWLRVADGLLRGPWYQIVSVAAIVGLCFIAGKLIDNGTGPMSTQALIGVVAAMGMILAIGAIASLMGNRDHERKKQKQE